MVIASSLHWHRFNRVVLATTLAFLFGYMLTFRGAYRAGSNVKEASRIAFTTDTVSITSMEIVDNVIEWLIPKALSVTIASVRFWWGLALSLTIAFVVTVPVNRFIISRSPHPHH